MESWAHNGECFVFYPDVHLAVRLKVPRISTMSSFFLQGCPRDDLFIMAGFRECSKYCELKDRWMLLLFFGGVYPKS